MKAYKVAQGTQVHHEGKTYGEGATVHAEPAEARLWLSGGWVTEVRATTKRAKSVEDKSAE